MPLGTEVGLGPDDLGLGGDRASPRKWVQQHHYPAYVYFGSCLCQTVAHLSNCWALVQDTVATFCRWGGQICNLLVWTFLKISQWPNGL